MFSFNAQVCVLIHKYLFEELLVAACGLTGATAAPACPRLLGPTWGLGVDLYFLSCPESVGLETGEA